LKVLKWFDRHIEEVVMVALTWLLLIVLFLQVLFRFVIKLPLGWTEEIAINALPWLCYFGSSLAVRERKHMRVDIVVHFMPPVLAKIFDLVADICFLGFSVFVLYFSSMLTRSLFINGAKTAVLGWSKGFIYIGIPIAFALTLYRLVMDIIRCCKEIKGLSQNKKEGN
jgi:TRAP-type C4-dicarboxylate transport system permease small subunit